MATTHKICKHKNQPAHHSNMHRSYQPFTPVTNRYLQQRWDQSNYNNHRRKVSTTLPVVDTKGSKTPTHMQLKLKKLQQRDERLSIIDRDNSLLASKLAAIVGSKGLVDHWNPHYCRSLNAHKQKQELLSVGRQNQAIYQRIVARQSEYRRQLWLEEWERTERRLENISRYPRGLANKQQLHTKVKFTTAAAAEEDDDTNNEQSYSWSSSNTEASRSSR